MVSKILILILLSALSVQAEPSFMIPTGLRLYWNGEKSLRCQHLVEVFLTELRSMAADHVIELEVNEKNETKQTNAEYQKTLRPLNLICEQDKTDILDVKDEQSTLKMHYLAKASGFDSMDWLPFQEKYLRFSSMSTEPNLSPTESKKNQMAVLPVTQIYEKKDSVFQQWWFWGIVGGVIAGSAYLLTRPSDHNSQVTMELH